MHTGDGARERMLVLKWDHGFKEWFSHGSGCRCVQACVWLSVLDNCYVIGIMSGTLVSKQVRQPLSSFPVLQPITTTDAQHGTAGNQCWTYRATSYRSGLIGLNNAFMYIETPNAFSLFWCSQWSPNDIHIYLVNFSPFSSPLWWKLSLLSTGWMQFVLGVTCSQTGATTCKNYLEQNTASINIVCRQCDLWKW